jgi:uncharacterized protein YyaL (SSP411 family)
MNPDAYTSPVTAEYINQHFVAVKVEFDAAPALVAQLQRAQTVLNLPAGFHVTSFISPEGKLCFGGGMAYSPAERQFEKSSFREAADEALRR